MEFFVKEVKVAGSSTTGNYLYSGLAADTQREFHVIENCHKGLEAVMAICKSYEEAESFRKGAEAGYQFALRVMREDVVKIRLGLTQSENAGVR